MARIALLMLALVAGLVTPVFADDWVALKLRGVVLELVDGQWQRLERGDAVPETHVVRTLGTARVVFQRGTETVELGPDTQIQIFQRARDKFTTVKQYFGEVTVEADVRTVKHFAVQAPQLVAVVKGTVFTVTADKNGASVSVERGAVGVTSTTDRSSVTVRAGQEASTGESGTLEVSGSGVLPVVVDAHGKSVASEVAAVAGANATEAGQDVPTIVISVSSGKGKSGDDEDEGDRGKGKGDKSGKGSDNSGKSGKGGSGHGDDDEDDDDDD